MKGGKGSRAVGAGRGADRGGGRVIRSSQEGRDVDALGEGLGDVGGVEGLGQIGHYTKHGVACKGLNSARGAGFFWPWDFGESVEDDAGNGEVAAM